MKNVGFYNGKWNVLTKSYVPMCDRACYFGDGIYDACYTRNKIIFAEDEHIERFLAGCKEVGIFLQQDASALRALLHYGVSLCDEGELFVYMQSSRGIGIRNHSYNTLNPSLWIMIYPKKIAEKSLELNVITLPDMRYNMCNVKTLNLMPNILASKKAEEKGCQEAVFFRDNFATECAHSNVQILQNNRLISPPPSYCTLGGIGRKHLIFACHKLGVEVDERRFSYEEYRDADEVILSSAGYPCQRVDVSDGKKIGGKSTDLFTKIQDFVYEELYLETKV